MKNKWVMISAIVILALVISISALYFSRVNAVSVDIAGKDKEFRPGLTTKQKLEDFDYLYNTLMDNFPYFDVEARKTGYYWPEHKSEFEGMIRNTKDDKEFYATLNEILNMVHNGHTDLVTIDGYAYDKYTYSSSWDRPWKEVIESSYEAYKQWANILSIPLGKFNPPQKNGNMSYNNVETSIMEKGRIAYMKIESFGNEFIEVDNDKIKNFLMSVKDYPYIIIDIRGNGGGSTSYWADDILKYLLNNPVEYNSYFVFRNGDYIQPFIRAKEKRYDSIKRPSTEITLDKTPPEVKKEGFGYCIKYENNYNSEEPIGFKGKIFLLVDKDVYSSAEAFASFCKTTGFATLVGVNTGGDGIGFDPVLVALPNSKLIVRFPMDMGLNPDGSSNEEMGTAPDIYVEQKRVDTVKSRDSVIQKVLEIIYDGMQMQNS